MIDTIFSNFSGIVGEEFFYLFFGAAILHSFFFTIIKRWL